MTEQQELSHRQQRPRTREQPVLPLLSLLNKTKLSTIPWLDSFFRNTQKNALIQPCWSLVHGFALLCCCTTLLPGRKVIPTAPVGCVLLSLPATAPLSHPAWQTGTCWAAKTCSCSWAPARLCPSQGVGDSGSLGSLPSLHSRVPSLSGVTVGG